MDDLELLESYIKLALVDLLTEDGECAVALGMPLDGGTSFDPTGMPGSSIMGTVNVGSRVLNPWRTDLPGHHNMGTMKRVKRHKKRKAHK